MGLKNDFYIIFDLRFIIFIFLDLLKKLLGNRSIELVQPRITFAYLV